LGITKRFERELLKRLLENRSEAVVNSWLRAFGQNLAIAGFRDVHIGKPDEFFQEVKKETGSGCIQFFDASLVAGFDHLRFAALDGLNAFKSEANISNDLAMEILLYACARRQIREALNLIGIKPNTKHVVVLALSSSAEQALSDLDIVSRLIKGKRDDSVVAFVDDKVRRLIQMFNISDIELEAKALQRNDRKQAIVDLIVERMALLITQR
jgi:KEOPS complex subunit Cgi121